MSDIVYEAQAAGSIDLGDEVDIRPKIRVRCICCSEWVVLGEYGPDSKPIALHPIPQCKLFIESDLLEYVKKLRQHYEGN
jgi:hypothetical protein